MLCKKAFINLPSILYMSTKKEKKHFTLSYRQLLKQSFEKEVLFERDASILNARGITIARIAAFVALRDVFTAMPQNETARANITIDIDQRNLLITELKTAIKEVLGIAKITFGAKAVEYKTFGPTSISLLRENHLYELAMQVVARGNFYFAQMQPKGLTAAMLANITTLQNNLPYAIDTSFQTKVKRIITTQERIVAANNVFNEMKEMCNTAIVYFENRDKLKASEYLIYKVAGKQQQRNGKVKSSSIICPKLKGIAANSKFKLMAASGSTLAFYFSKTNGGDAGAKKAVVPVNADVFVEITAANLGYDKEKGFDFFCIKNVGEGGEEGVYKVRVKG